MCVIALGMDRRKVTIALGLCIPDVESSKLPFLISTGDTLSANGDIISATNLTTLKLYLS